MRDAMTEAGPPLDCRPHGLRKASYRLLADGGAAAHEIMAAPGHLTLAEAEMYTRESDRRRGGRAIFLRITRRTGFPKPLLPVWEIRENSKEIKMRGKRLALPRGIEPLFQP